MSDSTSHPHVATLRFRTADDAEQCLHEVEESHGLYVRHDEKARNIYYVEMDSVAEIDEDAISRC